MTSELKRLDKLRQVLHTASKGEGVAKAIVKVFSKFERSDEQEMVRRVILGESLEDALGSLDDKGLATRMLGFLVKNASVDAMRAAKESDRLISKVEHWANVQAQRVIEIKAEETRGLMFSFALGLVGGMIWLLVPLVAGFGPITVFASHLSVPSNPYLGVFFVLPGAFYLGLHTRTKRAYVNVILALVVYLAVVYLVGPTFASL